MAKSKVEELYQRHIKSLLPDEKLCLVELIAHDLVAQPSETSEKPKRSIMELHGLGKEIWKGIDAKKYVDELRREWDNRP